MFYVFLPCGLKQHTFLRYIVFMIFLWVHREWMSVYAFDNFIGGVCEIFRDLHNSLPRENFMKDCVPFGLFPWVFCYDSIHYSIKVNSDLGQKSWFIFNGAYMLKRSAQFIFFYLWTLTQSGKNLEYVLNLQKLYFLLNIVVILVRHSFYIWIRGDEVKIRIFGHLIV